MHDEDATLCARQKEVGLVDPAITYQIYIQRINLNRFTPCHMKNLIKISQLPGFSGNMSYRVHITELQPPPLPPPSSPLDNSDDALVEDDQVDLKADLEEEQAGEDEEEAVLGAYCTILEFSYDG